MKKVFIMIAVLVSAVLAQAQNYATLYMDSIQGGEFHYCSDEVDGVIFYRGEPNCISWYFVVNDEVVQNVDSVVLDNSEWYNYVVYSGCQNLIHMRIYFDIFEGQNPFAEPIIWKHPWESVVLNAPDIYGHEVHWYNDSTGYQIEVTEPDTCSVTITHIYGCGSETFSVYVYNNVEIYRATVDLETNLNKVTWQVTAEQAEYISEVKVYRDGLLVGTVPYESGYYLDAIGSDNAARNYRIVGVTPEGEDCPIASYEKGTIHTTYYEDVNHNLNMTWNVPFVEEGAQGTPTYFQICKYDPATGDLTVVDQVNATVTDYTCGVNQFDGGQAVIAAVFSDAKGFEELAFSNLTTYILGLGENSLAAKVYPNPTSGEITVECEGLSHVRIVNAYGQTVYNADLEGGQTRIDLSQMAKGIYMMHIEAAEGQTVRKIVVE